MTLHSVEKDKMKMEDTESYNAECFGFLLNNQERI